MPWGLSRPHPQMEASTFDKDLWRLYNGPDTGLGAGLSSEHLLHQVLLPQSSQFSGKRWFRGEPLSSMMQVVVRDGRNSIN